MDKHLLDLYTDYLVASFGATTATGLARLLDHTVSHDQITRFWPSARLLPLTGGRSSSPSCGKCSTPMAS